MIVMLLNCVPGPPWIDRGDGCRPELHGASAESAFCFSLRAHIAVAGCSQWFSGEMLLPIYIHS